jgi:carbonic anhydrase
MRFSFAAVLLLGLGATAAAAQSAHWEYQGHEGPFNWSRLDPAYKACGDGHQQSPIDIRGAKLNKKLKPLDFHFIAGTVTLENTGHAIVVHVNHGSTLVANDVIYELQQLVFHRPSEHTVKGTLTDMDVDFEYKSADGKLAIVSVLINLDENHPTATLATLWEHLPAAAGKTEKTTAMINPGSLLPADHGYWTYMGSLTAPPCTEGVRWFVMEQEIGLSRAQLQTFAALFKLNSRPLQDKNGRRIEANQ